MYASARLRRSAASIFYFCACPTSGHSARARLPGLYFVLRAGAGSMKRKWSLLQSGCGTTSARLVGPWARGLRSVLFFDPGLRSMDVVSSGGGLSFSPGI